MKVLVTGANGFVGSRLVRRLLEAGMEVVAGSGSGAGASSERDPRARWVELDVTNPAAVDRFVGEGGPSDALVHLAGMASVTQANGEPAGAWAVNAGGTAQVARSLAQARASGADPLLLFASSAEVYLPRADRPYRETDAVGPTTAYAASKLGGELAVLELGRAMALRVVVVRPFPHIGPGQAPTFWVAKRSRVLLEAKRCRAPAVTVGDLTPVRDFLHVDDVVDAYVALLSKGRPGEIYNVASGRGVTLEQVHTILEDVIGVHPVRERDAGEVRRDARAYLVGDAAKTRAATGWAPRRSLEETLREVVDAQAN